MYECIRRIHCPHLWTLSLPVSLPVPVPILKRFVHSRFVLLSSLLSPYPTDFKSGIGVGSGREGRWVGLRGSS